MRRINSQSCCELFNARLQIFVQPLQTKWTSVRKQIPEFHENCICNNNGFYNDNLYRDTIIISCETSLKGCHAVWITAKMTYPISCILKFIMISLKPKPKPKPFCSFSSCSSFPICLHQQSLSSQYWLTLFVSHHYQLRSWIYSWFFPSQHLH